LLSHYLGSLSNNATKSNTPGDPEDTSASCYTGEGMIVAFHIASVHIAFGDWSLMLTKIGAWCIFDNVVRSKSSGASVGQWW
jgi:hypothetical protein